MTRNEAVRAAARRAVLAHVFHGAPPPVSPYVRTTRSHRLWQNTVNSATAEARRFHHQFSDLPIKVQIVEPTS